MYEEIDEVKEREMLQAFERECIANQYTLEMRKNRSKRSASLDNLLEVSTEVRIAVLKQKNDCEFDFFYVLTVKKNKVPVVSSVVELTLSVLEVWGSLPRSMKLGTASPSTCAAMFRRSCVAQTRSRGDGPTTCCALGRSIAIIIMI